MNDTPSYFADWFPTLCDAVGLQKPAGLDGDSLWPVLTGKQPTLNDRRPMLWVFPEYGGQVAVRMGSLKVVRQGLKTKTVGPWEVYDLSTDRGERHDLADSRPEVVQQAEEVLRREVAANSVFPLAIPGIEPTTSK